MVKRFTTPFYVIKLASQDWWRDWVNMAALNLAWLLCCATLILGPPATFTLYEVAHEFVSGRSFEYRDLTAMMRRHFLQSWSWLLLNAGVALGVWLNLTYYSRLTAPWSLVLLLLTFFLAATWLVVQFYALPFLMEQAKSHLTLALRNAFFMVLASPWYSTVMFTFVALLCILATRLIFLLFLGIPLLVVVLGSHAVRERLSYFRVKAS